MRNRQSGAGDNFNPAAQRNHSVPFNLQNMRGGGPGNAAAANRPRPTNNNINTNANVTPAKTSKKIPENLPRTGVEYPVMKL